MEPALKYPEGAYVRLPCSSLRSLCMLRVSWSELEMNGQRFLGEIGTFLWIKKVRSRIGNFLLSIYGQSNFYLGAEGL